MSNFLIYGAYGYTGRLAAEHARARGLRPILAGRNSDRVRSLADELGLAWRAFPLDTPTALHDGLHDVAAVLHAAGPFSATAKPITDACLHTGTHYVDITGEIAVFEALAARAEEAGRRGVVLLPGAGFDVVPSDCLAAHMKRRMPTATRLRIAIAISGGVSRGTSRTMVEGASRGTLVRRSGRIVELQRAPRTQIDFGNGPRVAMGASWGDVATAWHTTHIPDIDVYFKVTRAMSFAANAAAFARPLLAKTRVQQFLKQQIDRHRSPGPTPQQRAHGGTTIVADAWDEHGAHITTRLTTAEAYTLTAWTAVEIVRRVAAGAVSAGFQTPAGAFGPDFILEFDGSTRVDLTSASTLPNG